MEVISSVFGLIGVIFSQTLRLIYLTMLPFICLNGILVSVFLLKMLFFKPKFVENRQQTFTVVDPGAQIQAGVGVSSGGGSEGLQGRADMVADNGTPTSTNNSRMLGQLGAELPTTRSMMSRKIEQLYNTESFADAAVEYLTPYNPTQPIKFAEKLGAGFVGMIFKLQASEKDKASSAPAKCAKLVDVRTLLHIIEELNYVQGTLSTRMRLTALFRASTVGGSFMMKYLNAYHRFLDSAKQLEIGPQAPANTGTSTSAGSGGGGSSRPPRQHPNVHYYEQVLVYHDPDRVAGGGPRSAGSAGKKGGLVGPTGLPLPTSLTSTSPVGELPKKTFKRVAQVERQQLPSLVMLVMEQARLNLRSVLIYEWYSLQTVPAAAEWGRQVGSGLAYLHVVLGFAHLNVKAENVLLFESGGDNAALLPLHARFTAKISDCATAFLLPTVSRVLSQSHETSLWEVSPPGADKFALSSHEAAQWYDVHCFSMLLLLMLAGYEQFGRRYMLSMFPTGLLSGARYRLLEIITEDAASSNSSVEIPEHFLALFKVAFGEKNGKVSMKQLLAMDVFKA